MASSEWSRAVRILRLPKGAGKTSALIELMVANPHLVYVATTMKQADEVRKRMNKEFDHKFARWRFQSAATMINRPFLGYDGPPLEFAVDELDSVLSALLNGNVTNATTSAPITFVGTLT